MGFNDRENKHKNVVSDIINITPDTTKTTKPQTQEKTKNDTSDQTLVRKTFYITNEQIKTMAYHKADTGEDLSTIVRNALDLYFKK